MRSGRIPSCQLQARWIIRDDPPTDLSQIVRLVGAKKPNDFFLLTIDCGTLRKQGIISIHNSKLMSLYLAYINATCIIIIQTTGKGHLHLSLTEPSGPTSDQGERHT